MERVKGQPQVMGACLDQLRMAAGTLVVGAESAERLKLRAGTLVRAVALNA